LILKTALLDCGLKELRGVERKIRAGVSGNQRKLLSEEFSKLLEPSIVSSLSKRAIFLPDS
jgi:hypothetical protein